MTASATNAPSPGPNERPLPAPSDGDVFFEGSSQLRILRHLEQAIAQDDRLTVLTGDEGVGKTTVVQRLLRGLDPGALWWVLLPAAQLDIGELPGSLARAFGMPTSTASPAGGLHADLHRHLAQHAAGRTVLAVIDDAHGLPPEAVAELDDLTCEGPLRALLVGRSALRMNLQNQLPLHPASLSCHLEPLPAGETPAYIEHRLRRVGWGGTPEFTDEARALIHRFSRGVPQRINRLCDRLWSAARQRGEGTIGADSVRRIAHPRGDAAAIPMLTSTVDEPLASGWFAASELPLESELPRWAGPASEPAAVAARQRRIRLGVLAATGVVGFSLALWAWRAWEPSKPDAPLTVAQPAAESPPPPAPAPTAPTAPTTATPAPTPPPTPAATPAAAAPAKADAPLAVAAERARPPTPPRAAAPTRPPNRDGTPVAPPSPVPGPCTATVAALGLCTPTGNAP